METSTDTFVKHVPCAECGSSDAGALYKSGNIFCHKCQHLTKANKNMQTNNTPQSILSGNFFPLKTRGINKDTCEFWGYQIGHVGDRVCHIANHLDNSGNPVAQKLRFEDKSFTITGDKNKMGLYGKWLWKSGGNRLIITEGEIDALSVSQLQGNKWPVVSVPNGAAAALNAIKKDLEWVSSFDKVIFMFDNDEEGRKATQACCEMLAPGKAYVAKLPLKDPNEMLLKGKSEELKTAMWQASPYRPDGIEDFGDIRIEAIQNLVNVGAELPFPKLNEKLRGLKEKHLYTIAAREKSGKTTVTKMIALDLIRQGHKVGLMYLEEDADEARVSTYALLKGVPMWKVVEDLDVLGGPQEIQRGIADLKGKGLYIYNHKGEFGPDVLLSRIRYMILGLGCKYIVLDNLSISIACDSASNNERKMIDKLVAQCVSLIQNTGATLLNVVHLRKNRTDKDGEDSETVTRADIHGSGAFAKFSHAIIGLERDSKKNQTFLKVLANRDVGYEGYCDVLEYNSETGQLDVKKSDQEF